MTYTIEASFKLFDDATGTYYEISNDKDGLGLCRISYVDHDATETPEIFLERHAVPMLIEALKSWHAQTE